MTRTTGTTTFDSVVCGVDGSTAGATAARAAAIVAAPDGELALLAVNDTSVAVHAGWGMPHVLAELEKETARALAQARAQAQPRHRLDAAVAEGDPVGTIVEELEARDATLVVVGSHGISRPVGIALGAVSTRLLHDAPCSVLVVRGTIGDRWPRRIVVGVDGSEQSTAALEAARGIRQRFGAELRVLVGTDDDQIDLDAARLTAPECEEHEARALDMLNVASETADLIVVGSRGLRGLRALGSLSERIAHEARCSVLVVRPAA